MTVRITRIMQYRYPDITSATEDMLHWQVPPNGPKVFGTEVVTSAVLPVDLLQPEDQDIDVKEPLDEVALVRRQGIGANDTTNHIVNKTTGEEIFVNELIRRYNVLVAEGKDSDG